MPSTERRQRYIDRRLDNTAGGTTLTGTSGEPAGPAVPAPPAPQSLRVTGTKLLFSAVSPTASASLAWLPPVGTTPQRYLVQWATNSGFTGAVSRRVGVSTPQTAEIDGLPAGTLVYFRVAAVVREIQGNWSATVSTTTPADTTPPAAPTSLVTAWSGLTGDLDIRWTNPTSPNFRDVRVRIYASNGGALLREVYSATGRYVWTLGQHAADTSGSYDPSVYIVLTARSWGGVLSTTDLTGTATLAAPSAPAGLAHSWASDDGTAGAGLRVTWTRSDAVAYYRLSIDGVTAGRERIASGGYDYPFTLNQAEHAGSPAPVLSLSLVAVDALGQASGATAATATNAAPPATTLTAFGAFSSVGLTITPSTALDLKDYRVRVYRDGELVRTFYTTETHPTYAVEDGNGDYRFDVAARDAFGQIGTASAQTTALTLTDLTGFVAELRAGLIHTDSIGTPPADLRGLKDGNVAEGVITYAGGATWKWTMGDWGERITYQTSEVAHAGTIAAYISYSLDGETWGYYYGGAPAGGRWVATTFTATEATAQAGAVSLDPGTWRIDLPQPVPARYIRLHHRNTDATYTLREFFPSTLIRGTYVQAESITTVALAAGAVTADKLTATAIDGFTITGALIRTAASGQRVEISSTGLRTYDSGGTVQVEATTATDGALLAGGANAVRLDKNGISLFAPSSDAFNALTALKYQAAGSTIAAAYAHGVANTAHNLTISTGSGNASTHHTIRIETANWTDGSGTGAIHLVAGTVGLATTYLSVARGPSGGAVNIFGSGLNVGTASGAATGEIRASGGLALGGASSATPGQIAASLSTSITNTSSRVLILEHSTSGTPAANFGIGVALRLQDEIAVQRDAAQIVASWRTTPSGGVRRGQLSLLAYDQTAARTGLIVSSDGSGAMLGFYGESPLGRQTVTGSRGGNAALTSLLTALANLGLIINSTS